MPKRLAARIAAKKGCCKDTEVAQTCCKDTEAAQKGWCKAAARTQRLPNRAAAKTAAKTQKLPKRPAAKIAAMTQKLPKTLAAKTAARTQKLFRRAAARTALSLPKKLWQGLLQGDRGHLGGLLQGLTQGLLQGHRSCPKMPAARIAAAKTQRLPKACSKDCCKDTEAA